MAAYTPSLHNNLGFLNTIQLVKPHSLEEAVQFVWQEIVMEWFPGRHGYKWGFKSATLANDNMPDVTVIQVRALVQNPSNSAHWEERQILLVECKRPSSDTPSGWQNTITGQFLDDLSETTNHSSRLFGAVAIGKKVRFYRFDGRAPLNQQLVQLHQGTIDMETANGVTQVETMMNYVGANAWQWASS